MRAQGTQQAHGDLRSKSPISSWEPKHRASFQGGLLKDGRRYQRPRSVGKVCGGTVLEAEGKAPVKSLHTTPLILNTDRGGLGPTFMSSAGMKPFPCWPSQCKVSLDSLTASLSLLGSQHLLLDKSQISILR